MKRKRRDTCGVVAAAAGAVDLRLPLEAKANGGRPPPR